MTHPHLAHPPRRSPEGPRQHPRPRRGTRTGLAALVLAGLVAGAAPTQAALQARDLNLDGIAEGWYDTTLGITWLADAGAAAGSVQDDGASASDGLLSWAAAQAWVAGLRVGGTSGWRLPGIDTTCNGAGLGYGCAAAAGELGHQFHVTLGGRAGLPLSGTHNANHALFSGLGDSGYWARDVYAADAEQAGVMQFSEGYQEYGFKAFSEHAAWAVHDGDVLAVPEPASASSLLGGLLALGLGARWRRAVRGRLSA